MPLPLPSDPDNVPMGANVVANGGGATFRCWAPRARTVAVHGDFNGWPTATPFAPTAQLTRRGDHWIGFAPGAKDGDAYKFFVEGAGTTGYKRDPWARELTRNGSNCILRDPGRYRWHDQGFRPPAFGDLILYQLHVGVYHGPNRSSRVAKFLDLLRKLDYLRALGVNAVQLLPIAEWRNMRSLGYEGIDIFSPEMDYTLPADELEPDYLGLVNGLRARHGIPPLTAADLAPQSHQLKAVVELFHLNGIAVLLDLVYNHAGSPIKGDPESLWFFDRAAGTADLDSLYFSEKDWAGPMWAVYKPEVKQFLIDNAVFWLREYHADGFRYDETSAIVANYQDSGRVFCRHLSETVRATKPEAIQIGEFWMDDRTEAWRHS